MITTLDRSPTVESISPNSTQYTVILAQVQYQNEVYTGLNLSNFFHDLLFINHHFLDRNTFMDYAIQVT